MEDYLKKKKLPLSNDSMYDYFIEKNLGLPTISAKKAEEGNTNIAQLAYDILEKQHVGFDIGDLGFLEFAGPKGPNLSPIQKTGRQKDYYGRAEYKKDIPGFSMKLTKKFQ